MITVAIPTLARPRLAIEALNSVLDLGSRRDHEVLILDNGCSEELATEVGAIASRHQAPVRYIPVREIGLHSGRHEAARQAQGDIVAYLDDDVVVQPGWLDGIAGAFDDQQVHLVGGRCLPRYESTPPSWLELLWKRSPDGTLFCSSLSLVDPGTEARDIDPAYIFGANFAIRKSTLFELGGFHPDGLPWELRRFRGDGETAVARAASLRKLRAWYSPDATLLHFVPTERMTQGYLERRAHLDGISASFAACRQSSRHATGDVTSWKVMTLARRLLATSSMRLRRRPDSGTSRLEDAMADAFVAGYEYHQGQMRRDPLVRAWVERADFWDASVPA
jgi:glycosyltransferase involved in cell wall biosynthesis